jgi:hypothetical protein
MKIDFRRYVKVLPEFADWLEEMLEPAVEDRFESAKVALEALRGNKDVTSSVPLPTESKHEPPKRFRVKRSDQHLVVEILPTGRVCALIGFFFFLAVSPLFWFITPFFLFLCLRKFAERIRLKIDQQNFRLQWMIWGLTTRQIQGKTVDIERIERVDIIKNKTPTSYIIFWEGVRQHQFTLASIEEEQWLADEASDFILQLRYGKRSALGSSASLSQQ